jgi:hypothetical protein
MESAAAMTSDPMFKSVGQALSIAFAVTETPPAVRGTTDRALRDLKEDRYGLPAASQGERSINKEGLNDREFRAQCVLIVDTVDTRLAGHERGTVIARFTRQAVKRAHAVRALRDSYASLCNTQNSDAVLALIWSIYTPGVQPYPNESPATFNARRKRRAHEWSARTIEKEYGVGRNVLNRDLQMLREMLIKIELQAQERLERIFVRDGLLAEQES